MPRMEEDRGEFIRMTVCRLEEVAAEAVVIEGDEARIYPGAMRIGQRYRFTLNGSEYVATRKDRTGTVEVLHHFRAGEKN